MDKHATIYQRELYSIFYDKLEKNILRECVCMYIYITESLDIYIYYVYMSQFTVQQKLTYH